MTIDNANNESIPSKDIGNTLPEAPVRESRLDRKTFNRMAKAVTAFASEGWVLPPINERDTAKIPEGANAGSDAVVNMRHATRIIGVDGQLTELVDVTSTKDGKKDVAKIIIDFHENDGNQPDHKNAHTRIVIRFTKKGKIVCVADNRNQLMNRPYGIPSLKVDDDVKQKVLQWGVNANLYSQDGVITNTRGNIFDKEQATKFEAAFANYQDRLKVYKAKVEAERNMPEHPEIPDAMPDHGFGYADSFDADKALEAASEGRIYIADLSLAHLIWAMRRRAVPESEPSEGQDTFAIASIEDHVKMLMVQQGIIKQPANPVQQLHKRIVYTLLDSLTGLKEKQARAAQGENINPWYDYVLKAGCTVDTPRENILGIDAENTHEPSINVDLEQTLRLEGTRPATPEDFAVHDMPIPDNITDYDLPFIVQPVSIVKIGVHRWNGRLIAEFVAPIEDIDPERLTGFNPLKTEKSSDRLSQFKRFYSSSSNLSQQQMTDAVEATREGRL